VSNPVCESLTVQEAPKREEEARVHELWVSEPWHGRLFNLYLTVVSCVLIVRSQRLAWRLYSFSSRKRFSLANIGAGIVTPEFLAESGLTNKLCDAPSVENGDRERPTPLAPEPMPLPLVHAAENRFAYLWEGYYAEVRSTKSLAVLTLLLSLLVVSYGAHATFLYEFNNRNITGMQALVYAGFRLLDRLARGLLVSTALYGVAIFFEGALIRRRRRWNHFCGWLTNRDGVNSGRV
jgi:hypothetical protein